AALLLELHVEIDLGGARLVLAHRVERDPDAGVRVDPDDDLAGLRSAPPAGDEGQSRRAPEEQPYLGLGEREALAGADEERHPRPPPAVDVKAQRRVGLGGRVGPHAVDLTVALVLDA